MAWSVERWSGIPELDHGFGGRGDDPPTGVRTLRQVHGRAVHEARDLGGPEREGDAVVAGRDGDLAGVWTADCVPILLVAPAERVAAAVHSGWRGTVADVIHAALASMRARHGIDPGRVEAAIGPAIGACCYEVGPEVRDAFRESYGETGLRAFEESGGRLRLDLRRFLAARLEDLAVGSVETVGPCTSCRTDLLYSYRREGRTGRQISWIGFRAGNESL